MAGERADKFLVTASITRVINGVEETRRLGTFDSWEGGGSEAEDTTYKRGGMADQESLGGSRSVNSVTIGRLYDDFMQENEDWIDEGVGAARITGTKQPLDDDKNVKGKARVYTGKVTGWNPPDHDSEDTDPSRCEIVFMPNGNIG